MGSRRLRGVARHVLGASPAAEPQPDADPIYTLAEVAEHRTRQSAWVALHGEVYDFTAFVDAHPGGARGLLRHAGTDASDAFTELHTQSIFATFAPRYRIGRLAPQDAAASSSAQWAGVSADARFWEGLRPDEPVDPNSLVLSSPFPHDRFPSSGLETFRFNWAQADRLLRADDEAAQVPPADERAANHMFRQKSSLGVLNIERDWLYLDQAGDRSPALPGYASEMSMKRILLTEAAHHTYVTDPAAVAAEAEVLEMVIEFVLRRYPTRFAMLDGGDAIATLSEGYEHTFVLADWAEEPLKLAGMLVQEDMYSLRQTFFFHFVALVIKRLFFAAGTCSRSKICRRERRRSSRLSPPGRTWWRDLSTTREITPRSTRAASSISF